MRVGAHGSLQPSTDGQGYLLTPGIHNDEQIAGWRKVMMWWFIVTDGLLFAGFLGSYGYARILTSNWPDQSHVFSLPYIAAMTFVLISSSATMAGAVESARQRRWDAVLERLKTAVEES